MDLLPAVQLPALYPETRAEPLVLAPYRLLRPVTLRWRGTLT